MLKEDMLKRMFKQYKRKINKHKINKSKTKLKRDVEGRRKTSIHRVEYLK